MTEIRLLVSGSRDGYDPDRFALELGIEIGHLTRRLGDERPRLVLIHGNAKGVDQQAHALSSYFDQVIAMSASWDAYGVSAGPRRNERMLKEGKPTHGLIFPGGRGTSDMMNRLFAARIPFRFVG